MSNQKNDLLTERLEAILNSLERIQRRFSSITKPSDFNASEDGIDRMDAICMSLIAVGEAFKKIDRQTNGELFARYPTVQWRGVMGLRDVLAHDYFDIDVEQLYTICSDRVPELIEIIKEIIDHIRVEYQDGWG